MFIRTRALETPESGERVSTETWPAVSYRSHPHPCKPTHPPPA